MAISISFYFIKCFTAIDNETLIENEKKSINFRKKKNFITKNNKKSNIKNYKKTKFETITNNTLSKNSKKNIVLINIFLIRHAHALHNASKFRFYWKAKYFDPKLSNNGIKFSKLSKGKFKKKIDSENINLKKQNTLFFCSPARRCHETIYLMFEDYIDKNNNVYIIPYLLEEETRLFGIKYRLPENSISEKIHNYEYFNYDMVSEKGYYHKKASSSDLKKGIDFIFKNFDFFEKSYAEISNIIIMTHSHLINRYLKTVLNSTLPKPLNNESILLKIEYNINTKKYQILQPPQIFTKGIKYKKKFFK